MIHSLVRTAKIHQKVLQKPGTPFVIRSLIVTRVFAVFVVAIAVQYIVEKSSLHRLIV